MDEKIRHSITKMSSIHFPSIEEYAKMKEKTPLEAANEVKAALHLRDAYVEAAKAANEMMQDLARRLGEAFDRLGDIVKDVLSDNSNRHITITTDDDLKKKPTRKRKAASVKNKATASKPQSTKPHPQQTAAVTPTALKADDSLIGKPCPKCGKGHIIKGRTAYGCSEWKNGCDFRLPFSSK